MQALGVVLREVERVAEAAARPDADEHVVARGARLRVDAVEVQVGGLRGADLDLGRPGAVDERQPQLVAGPHAQGRRDVEAVVDVAGEAPERERELGRGGGQRRVERTVLAYQLRRIWQIDDGGRRRFL